jgi:hypothetical protein
MKNTIQLFSCLVMAALILIPVSVMGEGIANTTVNSTAVTTTAAETSVVSTGATPVANETTTVATATPTTNATTATTTTTATVTTAATANATTVAETGTTTATTLAASAGTVSFTSSPSGAYVLVDGVFSGNTPVNLTDVTAGNHIVRLTLSGYYDYEGTMYVVPDKVTYVFGTLPPLGSSVTANTATATTTVPDITVQATQTSSSGSTDTNPAVIAAIIGVVTACIGAGATIFSHYAKLKKE